MLSTIISYILEGITGLCIAGLLLCIVKLLSTVNLDWLSKFSILDHSTHSNDDGLGWHD